MILADGVFGLLLLGVWIFCIIDVITTPEPRNLPKFGWLLIVVLLMDVGSIAWLVAGRNWSGKAAAPAAAGPGHDRPARATSPDDDEEFLAQVRMRAEAQRRAVERDRLRKRPDEDA